MKNKNNKVKKLWFLIFISFLFTQCYYDKIDTVDYVGYYEDVQQKVKLKGRFISQKEHGTWHYYSEDGVLTQHGKYDNGLQQGVWIYNHNGFIDTLNWFERTSRENLSFSLPDNFVEIKNAEDKEAFTAVDSISGNVFYIKIVPDFSKEAVVKYFDDNYSALMVDYNNIESKSDVINGNGWEYFLDSYLLVHKTTGKKLFMHMLYQQFNNQLLVLGYVSNPIEKEKSKIIIEDVFHHMWMNKQRVLDPHKEVFATSK